MLVAAEGSALVLRVAVRGPCDRASGVAVFTSEIPEVTRSNVSWPEISGSAQQMRDAAERLLLTRVPVLLCVLLGTAGDAPLTFGISSLLGSARRSKTLLSVINEQSMFELNTPKFI